MDHKEIRNAEHSLDIEPGTPTGRDSPDSPAVRLAAGSSTSPGLVQRLVAVAKDNYKTAFITIVIVLIILLETTLDNALFKCPCSTKGQNIAYAVIFVVWPSVTLLILGILNNNSTWRLVTGCWHRTKPLGYKRGCVLVTQVLAKALFAPFAWITYGFIDARFYVCAVSDDPCERGNTTVTISADEARQDAQIIGYVLLMTGSGIILLCILLKKGFSKYSFEEDDYNQIYRAVERVEMLKQLEAQAHETAQREVTEKLREQLGNKPNWGLQSSGNRTRPPRGRKKNLPLRPMHRTSTQPQTSK